MTDFDALVQGAQDKGTFSVLDAIKNKAYPEDIKTVYTDTKSAYEIKGIEKHIANLGEDDAALINELDDQIVILKNKIKASALTFRLRGIGSDLRDAIQKEAKLKFPWTDKSEPSPADYGPGGAWVNRTYLAAHIVDVTDADGNVDSHKWDDEKVEELRMGIPDESFLGLIQLMQELSFAATYFDASVTPDFS